MPTWPKDTLAAKIAFYGDPRTFGLTVGAHF